MMDEWQADGYGYDDLEVWVISISGELDLVPSFMQGSTSSAFEGNKAAGEVLGVPIYTIPWISEDMALDLVILDRESVVHANWNAISEQLPAKREEMDAIIRSLLEE